jgi:four helix bundle protein
MSDFKKLIVFRKAHELTLELYRATETFPRTEVFGLTSQIKRAASSINANLAEGCARGSDRELLRFINIAIGSVSELEYHLMLARDLGFISSEVFLKAEGMRREVGSMLSGLAKKVRTRVHMQVHATT